MISTITRSFRGHWKTIGLVALALILRVCMLNERGIWYDDAFSILLAKQPLGEIFSGTAADTMPPLYYIMLHYWMKISDQIFWIRSMNLLIFGFCLLYIFTLVKRISSKSAAWFAVLFCSLSPFLVYHSQEIRMYMLLVFFQTAYLFYFINWSSENSNRRDWIGMMLCGAGALYTHNLAVFGLLIPGVYLICKRNFSRLWYWLGSFVISIVLFLPWLVYVPGQIEKIQTAFWTPRPGVLEVIQSIYSLFSFLPQPFPWVVISGVLCFQLLGLLFWELFKQRHRFPYGGFLLLGIGFPPLILFILSYFMRPVYVARGFILTAVMVYCLAGILTARGWSTAFGKIILFLMVLLSGISLPFYYGFATFPRSPFAEACAAINHQVQDSDELVLVLHDNKLSYFPCVVYAPALGQTFLADEPGSHNDTLALASQQAMQIFPEASIQTAVMGKSDIYFVVFTRALQEYADLKEGLYPPLQFLSNTYQEMDIAYYNDLAVYHYGKKSD